MIDFLIAGGAVICAAVLLFFVFSLEPLFRKYNVETDKAVKLRVLQISDVHNSRFGKGQSKLSKIIENASPDVIFFTGDIIEDICGEKGCDGLEDGSPAKELIDIAVRTAPCFMVFGNHEAAIPERELLAEKLEECGVKMLQSEVAVLKKDSFEVVICGINDPMFFKPNQIYKRQNVIERLKNDYNRNSIETVIWRDKLKELADVKEEKRFTILLSHRPEEFKLYEELGYDIVFSGHAHGGQWRIPGIIEGVYAPHQGFFPKHAGGSYNLGKTVHIVSRGISKKRCPRIFNRPEICLVDIVGKE